MGVKMKRKKIETKKRTVLNYIDDMMNYNEEAKKDIKVWLILRDIRSIFELAIDEDEHGYYFNGDRLIITEIRHSHRTLLNGLSIIANEYVRNTQCLDIHSAIIEDYQLFLNNIVYLYTHQVA
jgi:hypothetical protein